MTVKRGGNINKHKINHVLLLSLSVITIILIAIMVVSKPVLASGTTNLYIKKLASDGTTIISEKTLNYHWLKDHNNIPVMGDGIKHYYHQGPVFVDDPSEETEQMLRWNQGEDTNVQEKDMGALMGTNLKDLCDLVGGMAPGDTVKIKATDGFNKTFAYKNVYEYSNREGPMVICWYKDGLYPDTGYTEGMRLVWFADASTNPWGINAFGNWDWHEAADSEYWYYYRNGGENYPTTTGLSIQNVCELTIYTVQQARVSAIAPVCMFSTDKTSGNVPLTIKFTDQSTNFPTSWAWDFNNDGNIDCTTKNPSYTYNTHGIYSVKLTVSNAAGSDNKIKVDYIIVNTETKRRRGLPERCNKIDNIIVNTETSNVLPLPKTLGKVGKYSYWPIIAPMMIVVVATLIMGIILCRMRRQ